VLTLDVLSPSVIGPSLRYWERLTDIVYHDTHGSSARSRRGANEMGHIFFYFLSNKSPEGQLTGMWCTNTHDSRIYNSRNKLCCVIVTAS
jgi:hypothetical protein